LDSEDGGRLRERRSSGSFVSDDILIYEEDVPHGWLFDRCQAVVTHGGAGTVGAALRAGKPVMVVPFWGDQFLW
jgi:sterol 3beta-glucosyltransferase